MFFLALVVSLVMAEPAKTVKPDTAAANQKPATATSPVPAATPVPVQPTVSSDAKIYGASDFAAPTVKLSKVLQDFETYKNQTVSVEGKVAQVCEQKGCWIRIEDQNISVRAIMKGHAFSVPKELKNKKVKITGIMEQKELPVNVVRHYMKDEGRSNDEIKKVTQPQKVFQFVVDGVQEI